MGTGDVELFPSDEKLTVDAIADLQAENQKLKNKLEMIEHIVNSELYVNGSQGKIEHIKEVLKDE